MESDILKSENESCLLEVEPTSLRFVSCFGVTPVGVPRARLAHSSLALVALLLALDMEIDSAILFRRLS